MMKNKSYKPEPETVEILNWCLAKVESVPYKVTLRWLFYRAMQERGLTKKDYGKFKKWTARARKNFWNGWRPDTLVDDTRHLTMLGGGFRNFEEWIDSFKDKKPTYEKFSSQENIVVVLFEAEAMVSQFRYYCSRYHVPYAPFKGDPSIDFKWKLAEYFATLALEYQKPVQILYFGDYEPLGGSSRGKGLTIPRDALKDIQTWYEAIWLKLKADREGITIKEAGKFLSEMQPLKFFRCGLNKEHIERWNLPENPTRPGEYQWETLGDDQARELIESNIKKYWSLKAVEEVQQREEEDAKRWSKILREVLINLH